MAELAAVHDQLMVAREAHDEGESEALADALVLAPASEVAMREAAALMTEQLSDTDCVHRDMHGDEDYEDVDYEDEAEDDVVCVSCYDPCAPPAPDRCSPARSMAP